MLRTRRLSLPSFGLFALGLCAAELWATAALRVSTHADLIALAITSDLILGIPLLYAVLVMRPYRLPPITIVPVFVAAIFVAGWIVPASHQGYLEAVRRLLPLVELAVLALALLRARAFVGAVRAACQDELYVTDALEHAARQTFGGARFVALATVELSLIGFALFGWFARYQLRRQGARAFSYHRTSIYPALFVVLMVVLVLETVALHLIVERWSLAVAWVLTALSVYSALWLIGDFHAMRLHPIVLDGTRLHLRQGLRWRAVVPLDAIAEIRGPVRAKKKSDGYLSFALAGDPQLVLVFKQPVTLDGLFGMQRQVTQVGLWLDDPAGFRAALGVRTE